MLLDAGLRKNTQCIAFGSFLLGVALDKLVCFIFTCSPLSIVVSLFDYLLLYFSNFPFFLKPASFHTLPFILGNDTHYLLFTFEFKSTAFSKILDSGMYLRCFYVWSVFV